MKFYITKYALTKGIIEIEGEVSERFPTIVGEMEKHYHNIYHKPYWWETREEAVAHAEEMRKKKLKSLRSQIAILEKKVF